MERHPTRRIGKYDVLGELGHGGMAVVYRARDSELLREVAIKVLHPHLANDADSRGRFLREAQAAARLRHPNIVEVFDFGRNDDDESYMVSEILTGPTLRRFAEQHPPMPAEVAAAVGIVLCDALACAHAQGVVHRDVKPDNVLMHDGGVLKLTDFGIAHVADAKHMTVTGQMIGSPAHMAPEQIEGGHVDARTDLFAVGTMLYALAVGSLPFDAPHPHALLRKILETDYPDPIRVAPRVGHRFAAVVRHCLEREPASRYADAQALRAALEPIVAGAHLGDAAALLSAYFADPEALTRALERALVPRLAHDGEVARAHGDVADALGYFNRALAIDPGNPRVLALVRGVARRRQFVRFAQGAGITGAAALLAAGGIVSIVRHARSVARTNALAARAAVSATAASPVVAPERTQPPPAIPVAVPIAARAGQPVALAPVLPVVPRPIRRALPLVPRAVVLPVDRTASAPRDVHLRITPGSVYFAIDGTQMREYGPSDTTYFSLVPGRHRVRVQSATADACATYDREIDVPSRAREPGTWEIRVALRCHVSDAVPGGVARGATAAAP